MKYNNQYYKIIAQLLDESVDNQHHTDLYYSKRIAESYGETYTDLGNLNKYLRDFAEDVGVELDEKHHTRLWYLKRIADKLYDSELEHTTENYYLRIISENIEPTPPTPPVEPPIVITINDDRFNSSYKNLFTNTGDITVDWGDGTTETYIDGTLTHNYASIGEYTIKIYGEITGLNQYAFNNTKIKTIAFNSDEVTTIPYYCFSSCSNLTSITLPQNLTTIGGYSFTGSTLTSINIPSTVTEIGNFAFMYCMALTTVSFNWESSEDIIPYSVRPYDQINANFSIPTGTTSLYEAKGYPSNKLIER